MQLAVQVGILQAGADLKIADRARDFLAAPRDHAMSILAHHVTEVVETRRLQTILEQAAAELRDQIAERQLIAKAKSTLQSTYGLSEEQAYSQLRATSRKSRRRLAVVARQFVEREKNNASPT